MVSYVSYKMNPTFLLEQRIVNHLILNSNILSDNSLYYGKTGIALAFYMYGSKHNKALFSIADALLKDIENTLYVDDLFPFGEGLSGVGWGIDYMLINAYAPKDNLIISKNIAELVVQYSLDRLLTNISDIQISYFIEYVLIHIKSCYSQKKYPFDKKFLSELFSFLTNNSYASSKLNNLIKVYVDYYIEGTIPSEIFNINNIMTEVIEFDNKDILLYPLGVKEGLSNYLLFH